MDARGIDNDPGWINREIQKLRREVESLRSERRAAATSIETGDIRLANGGSLIVDGGDVVMLDVDGSEIFRIGAMEFGDRGMVIKRENGETALEVRRLSGAFGEQGLAIYANGTRLLETDELFGGLRRPFFEHPFQPVSATPGTAVTCGPYGLERSTTSGTFETLFVYDGKRQNPLLDLKVAALCSDGTTAGEVRIVDLATGTQLPGFLDPAWLGVIAAGTTTYTVLDPTAGQAVAASAASAMSYVRLGIQVRRTAGSGSITLAVPQSIGG